jgi:hypothetical protein
VAERRDNRGVSRKRSEPESAALYGLPLGEFTKARNELAKEVRAGGDREQAEQIAGLPKPSLVAWALNMLPRLRSDELRQLLEAGEEAEGVQARALRGGEDGARLREVVGELRRSARRLAGEAGEILVKDGHAAREETLLRVAAALEAAAVTAEGREALERGTFAEEPEAAGFDLFASLSATAPAKSGRKAAPKPSVSTGRQERSEARQQARRAIEEARRELERRRRERVEAEAAARADERAAQAKQREAAEVRQAAERSEESAALARDAELKAKEQLARARAAASS